MLHIVGSITATTHIHQTDPTKEGNLSRTIKTYAWSSDQVRRDIPFVTGNSVRGVLRRLAADKMLDVLNKPVSRAVFSVMTTGKASRQDIGKQPSVQAMNAASSNVFAGLFGGGGYMIPSRYSMGPLMPMVEWCRDWLHPSLREKMIPKEKLSFTLKDGPDEGRVVDVPLVTQIILTSRDDVMAGKGENRIEDYQASVDAWIAEVTGGRAAKAADKAEKEDAKKRGEKPVKGDGKAISVDLAGFNMIEAMLPGTPLQFWLRFRPRTSEAQIGLMLLAVRDWANANVIGGASARGFGRFNAQLSLYDGDELLVPSIFNLADHAMSYTLCSELDHYVAAAEDAMAAITISDLDNVFATDKVGDTPVKASKPGKAGKTGKAAVSDV